MLQALLHGLNKGSLRADSPLHRIGSQKTRRDASSKTLESKNHGGIVACYR